MNFLDPRLPLRFWAKCIPEPNSGCWLWLGGGTRGYGQFGVSYKRGPSRLVHRIAYEAAHGRVPDGLQLDHLCRERLCCNPSHLEAVTGMENVKRGLNGDLKTECEHGHALSGHNLKIRREGGKEYRRCRTCLNNLRRRRRARQRNSQKC